MILQPEDDKNKVNLNTPDKVGALKVIVTPSLLKNVYS